MVQAKKFSDSGTLTPEEFVLQAIDNLIGKNGSKSKTGIHSAATGFDDAFQKYFGEHPSQLLRTMRREGSIAMFGANGGFMLYRRDSLKGATLAKHDAFWKERDTELSDVDSVIRQIEGK